jgi:hypothetical protein
VNQPQSSVNPNIDPQLVQMLSGMNASAGMAVVQRTRRNVLEAATDLREQRIRNRRTVGVVALTIAVLGMLLTPAIWSSVDDFLAGDNLSDSSGMVMTLIAMLFSAVLGALIVGLRLQQNVRHGRR